MANWCNNTLTVTGPDQDRDAFCSKLHFPPGEDHGGELILEDFCDSDVQCCNSDVWINPDASIVASFNTKWQPPAEWLAKVTVMFPTLEFELNYEEMGCVGVGRIRAHKNVMHECIYAYANVGSFPVLIRPETFPEECYMMMTKVNGTWEVYYVNGIIAQWDIDLELIEDAMSDNLPELIILSTMYSAGEVEMVGMRRISIEYLLQ